MTPTVGEIIDVFQSFVETVPDDVADPGDDILFLEVLIKELEAVQMSFSGTENSENLELAVACSRIPGLLHLFKIY